MNNSSNPRSSFADYDRTREADWIAPVTINVILMLSTFWMLISLIHHGIQTGKWKNITKKKAEKLNRGLVYTSVVVTAIFCFLRLLFSFIYMNVGFAPGENLVCAVFAELVAVTYACNIFSAMTFLWLRQRIFYTHRLLRVGYSKITKAFSVASIVIIYTGGLTGFIWLRASTVRFASRVGCRAITIFPPERVVLYLILIFLLTSFGQFTLLGLFIHALKRANTQSQTTDNYFHSIKKDDLELNACECQNQINSSENGVDGETAVSALSSSISNSGILEADETQAQPSLTVARDKRSKQLKSNVVSLKSVFKRTFIFAVISVLADAVVPAAVAVRGFPRAVLLIYDLNAFLSLVFVVFSFVNFKRMIFSPCLGPDEKN